MTAKSDVLVKMALVFFISLLSFSIGTFVGKKYSDNQHKLAALEPAGHGQRGVASENKGEHGESSMTDDEIAKLAEEFADDEQGAAKATVAHGSEHGEPSAADSAHGAAAAASEHGMAKSETVAATGHQTPSLMNPPAATNAAPKKASSVRDSEPLSAARELAAGRVPTEAISKKAETESRIPSSLPKDVAQYAVGKYTLQIASFNNEADAKSRAESLKGQGFGAFYVPATVNGQPWFRVNVGLFPSIREANDYKVNTLSKIKLTDAIVAKVAQ